MERHLSPGDRAPDLDLRDHDERRVTLADLAGHRVVLYFFPAAFSPGCTREVCGFRDTKDAWQAAGYQLYGISADSPERLREFREEQRGNHALLSDPDFHAARAWGAYGAKTIDGRPAIGPVRSTFVVGADGVLVAAEYDVEPTAHVAALLGRVASTSLDVTTATR